VVFYPVNNILLSFETNLTLAIAVERYSSLVIIAVDRYIIMSGHLCGKL
jgi:hypothetical protein